MNKNVWSALGVALGFFMGAVSTLAQTPNVAGALFVMTNSTDRLRGNEVGMFSRFENGDLNFLGYFPTGRLDQNQPQLGSGPAPTVQIFRTATGGAQPLVSAQFDGLASSNSLLLSSNNRCLFAVNAGSNSVSSFRVLSRGLELQSVLPSRGVFPVSLTTSQNLLYVLNSGDTGTLAGFRVLSDCRLTPFTPASNPSGTVSLAAFTDSFPTPVPGEVLTTPAQIAFTPDGARLVLSVKGSDASITGETINNLPDGRMVVFPVNADGGLATGVVTPFNATIGRGPFSFVVNNSRQITVVHANSDSIASYTINNNNTLSLAGNIAPVPIPDFAPCWIVRTGNFIYAVSAGLVNGVGGGTTSTPFVPNTPLNGAINGFRISSNGTLDPLGVRVEYPNAADILDDQTATGNHGLDLAVVGNYLYFIQARTGRIGRLTINGNGALTNLTNFGGFAPGVEPTLAGNPGIANFLERCYINGNAPECALGSAQGIAGF